VSQASVALEIPTLADVLEKTGDALHKMTDAQLCGVATRLLETQKEDRQENQILYYKSVSPQSVKAHRSMARYLCLAGGNGSSKTETALAHATMLGTGVFSDTLDAETRESLKAQFRGPIAIRVVVESLTTTLHNIILPKLMWWKWSGIDTPGGERGHWGWVPRRCLRNGSWTASWSEKLRTLKTFCYDPDYPEKVLGETVWQFMAKSQEPEDFASGDYHLVLHDELPSYAIWRENEARTMRVAGRMFLMFTWPDEPGIPVDWVYDTLYEKGKPGPHKDPDIDWFELWTEDNPNLDQEAISKQADQWSEIVKAARLRGQPIRFSNRVHALFTEHDSRWCFNCKMSAVGVIGVCGRCGGAEKEIVSYNHVQDFDVVAGLPTVYLLDPHPRKPHMMMWVQVDGYDDLWVVAEEEVDGDPDDVEAACDRIEREHRLSVVARIGDPNMLQSPAGAKRKVTWRDEFDVVGLHLDLADDSDVGRGRLNEYLKPDPDRRQPRIHIHPRCTNTIRQLLRYVWDDFKHADMHDLKQKPKAKDDDYPTLLKYLLNMEPRNRMLMGFGQVIKTRAR